MSEISGQGLHALCKAHNMSLNAVQIRPSVSVQILRSKADGRVK